MAVINGFAPSSALAKGSKCNGKPTRIPGIGFRNVCLTHCTHRQYTCGGGGHRKPHRKRRLYHFLMSKHARVRISIHHATLVGVAVRRASEARRAERTGAQGGFLCTARFACALPVLVSGWGRRGGWREIVCRSRICVCYRLEELHWHV